MSQRPASVTAVVPDLERPTRTTIIATLGPASEEAETIGKMIQAGVGVFRLNFSHGDLQSHGRTLAIVREVAAKMGRPTAVLGDLGGPKIRVARVPGAGIDVEAGQDVVFQGGVLDACFVQKEDKQVPVFCSTYPRLVQDVEPGQRVLINDGAVRMLAVERDALKGELLCRVTVGGLVTTGKGINLPDTHLQVPAITEKDWECVEWAAGHGLDFLALSFVRTAEEVLALKKRLAGMCGLLRDGDKADRGCEDGVAIPVVAKIEKPQAVLALEAIVEAADAVMVARGDLGVEMDLAQVPIVQKQIIARCKDWGRPSVVATQMLESMIESSSPTRAEVSDVANAVFDGADAVMLSGETAVGKHPVLVVETMRRIVAAAEARIAELPCVSRPPVKYVQSGYATAALAHGAWHIARDIKAKLVVCWSEAGGTARYLSQNEFRVPIIAYSSSARATRRMALLGGVTPVHARPPESGRLGDWTDMVERDLLSRGWAREGDPVVLLAGKPLGKARATNSIAILRIGDAEGGYRSHRS
jgi:pyruvate kinase